MGDIQDWSMAASLRLPNQVKLSLPVGDETAYLQGYVYVPKAVCPSCLFRVLVLDRDLQLSP